MPTVNETIFDAQIRHSVYLERYKSGVLRSIIGLLNDTETDLIEQIAGRLSLMLGRGYDPGPETTRRLNDLLKDIRAKRQDAYQALGNALADELLGFSRYEADFQVRLAENAGVDLGLKLPSNTQLQAIVTSQPFQGALLKEWASGLAENDIKRIHQAIRIGITEGETTDQIVRRVRGTKSAQFKNGILETSRREAEAVVRTSIAHVQTRARMETFQANSDIVQGVRYTATLDGRTSPVCRARDGKVFAVADAPVLPAHWNCRSVYTAFFGPRGGDRASKFGPVPAETTYNDWLKRQSKEFQDDVLGPARGKLFRAGVSVDRFVDKSGRSYTLKELARREKT